MVHAMKEGSVCPTEPGAHLQDGLRHLVRPQEHDPAHPHHHAGGAQRLAQVAGRLGRPRRPAGTQQACQGLGGVTTNPFGPDGVTVPSSTWRAVDRVCSMYSPC